MDFYSVALGLGLAAAITALVVGVRSRLTGDADPRANATRRFGRLAGRFSTFALFVAGSFHLVFGHGAGSDVALDPLEFVGEHPALLVGFVAVLLAAYLRRPGGSRSRRHRVPERSNI